TKSYTSFKQIETDLEILKLEKEIEYHKMMHSIAKSKESLTPKNLISSAIGAIGSKIANPYLSIIGAVLPFAVTEGIPFIKNWIQKRKRDD
ncbi:MAG: DUF6327 family protein, partial [Bacteroidota bacterium]